MESKTVDQSAWGQHAAPVVMRVRQQTGGPSPARSRGILSVRRMSSARWMTPMTAIPLLRSDHLIILASLPLVTLVIYLSWQVVNSTDADNSLRPKTLSLPTLSVPEIAGEKSAPADGPIRIQHQERSSSSTIPQESLPAQNEADFPILPTDEPNIQPMRGHSWSTEEPSVEHAVIRPNDQPLRLGRAQAIPTYAGRISSVEPTMYPGHATQRAMDGVIQGDGMSYAPGMEHEMDSSPEQ
ncbi:hypothetical protein K2X85_15665 [bacterium]|nr:hypothetical protein [bacterium]